MKEMLYRRPPPRRHPLAKKERLTWADLDGETLMLIKQGESPVLDRMRSEIEEQHPDIHIADLENFYDMEVFNTCEQKGYLMMTGVLCLLRAKIKPFKSPK